MDPTTTSLELLPAPHVCDSNFNHPTRFCRLSVRRHLRLFVNGVEASNLTVGGNINVSTGVLRIGGDAVWGQYFSGLIDEVRIYNRALSSSEIQTDMNTPL